MAKLLDKPSNIRYERKFTISDLSRWEVESIIRLHPAMFSEDYHERFVNNMYFDCPGFSSYFARVDGLNDRVKTRIRWYGKLFGPIENPVVEFKIKNGVMGKKERFSIAPFCVDKMFRRDRIDDAIKQSSMSEETKEQMKRLEISLLNRYVRKYFKSADRKCRITIDWALESYRIGRHGNTFLHRGSDRVSTIVELKYGEENERDGEWVANYFPFRLSRNSKYTNAVEELYSW